VLTEPCEQSGCDVNGPSFKGIYVRNLGELNRALDDHPYSDCLVHQASTAYDHNRNQNNECGLHWPGPIQYISGATQRIAVDLLVAAQPIFVRCAGTASTCQSVRCGSVLILGGAR
jgi:hypothetical protein